MKNKLKKLVKLNQRKKASKEELFYFLLGEIRKHIDEIKELKINNDPHVIKEIADMVLLSYMLSIHENINKGIFDERIKKIEEKMKKK